MKKLYVLLMALLLTTALVASTNVPDTIKSDQVWTIAGSPYLIPTTSIILKGVSVNVMPGVVVTPKNGDCEFTVSGELTAIGTKDSIIEFKNLFILFTSTSDNYNALNQNGCYFNYCSFTEGINATGANLGFKNCTFDRLGPGSYPDLYFNSSSDSSSITADSCSFNGYRFMTNWVSKNSTYTPIWPDSSYFNFRITNSNISQSYWSIQGTIDFSKNMVNESDSSHFYIKEKAIINCNSFKNVGGIHLHLDTVDTGSFNFNTLDSTGLRYAPGYGMLNIHTSTALPYFSFSYNNFLHLKTPSGWPGQGRKKVIIKVDSARNKVFDLDFSDCYWNTTVSNRIDSFTFDKSDTSALKSSILFSPVLLKPNYTCSPPPKCQASFHFGVDTAINNELYIIDKSRGVDRNTKYYWTFGDGNKSQDNIPVHTYDKAGNYITCLTIVTTDSACTSTFCDTIHALVDNFKIIVRDGKSSSIDPINNSAIVVYPNPNNGTFTIKTNTVFTPTINLSLLDGMGRQVYAKSIQTSISSNAIEVDASNIVDGVYYVLIQSDRGTYSQKMVIVH